MCVYACIHTHTHNKTPLQPTRMAKIKKIDIPSIDKDMERLKLSHVAGRNAERFFLRRGIGF